MPLQHLVETTYIIRTYFHNLTFIVCNCQSLYYVFSVACNDVYNRYLDIIYSCSPVVLLNIRDTTIYKQLYSIACLLFPSLWIPVPLLYESPWWLNPLDTICVLTQSFTFTLPAPSTTQSRTLTTIPCGQTSGRKSPPSGGWRSIITRHTRVRI